MERDPNLSKLFKESGVVKAPGGLTHRVMKEISGEADKKAYKPLIGKAGQITILLVIIGIVILSMLYSEQGGRIFSEIGTLSSLEWEMPQLNFRFDFFTSLNLYSLV